ncbi:ABC transporter ATP-binding protein [Planctomycetaceae bacterium SCGC AG-212-D15]|nr:ABC transporter ATP-binding protein [Planctomycetaceae bacterium SCGC AG-212-D15]
MTAAPTSATDLAVECRQVTKDFVTGDVRVQALRGVDLQVPPGEMTLLVGPSGCGKTTLISIIAGLLQPSAGDVVVWGTSLASLTPRQQVEFRRRNVGFVFQQYNLLPALTAAENAAVPLLVAGWRRRPAVAKARELLDAVGLSARADALPTELSGGQQQRVAIARALIHEPKLLVCDEPTAALDAALGQTVLKLIGDVAVQKDRAVIVVTHDSRVFHFGDRIIHMDDGRVDHVEARTEE